MNLWCRFGRHKEVFSFVQNQPTLAVDMIFRCERCGKERPLKADERQQITVMHQLMWQELLRQIKKGSEK